MNDHVPEIVKHRFFALEMSVKQLRHEQLSSYLQVWVLGMEALFLGTGIVTCIGGGFVLLTEGIDAALTFAFDITHGLFALAVVVTVVLRVAWLFSAGISRTAETADTVVEDREDD